MTGFFEKLFGGAKPPSAAAQGPIDTPSSVDARMESQASAFVEAFSSPDSSAGEKGFDYSEASLELVDNMLDGYYRDGASLPGDVHVLASAYVFEVARRAFGGRYLHGDADNPFVLVIGQRPAEVGVCVMAKIRGRAVNGPEDNIPFFYAGIAPLVAAGKNATLI